MISKAILSSPDNRLPLADIYAFIGRTFFADRPHAATTTRAWRNSVRHHLSVNDCFVRVGGGPPRQGRGRGNLWAVHSDCVEDFRRGDYRRRRWTVRRRPRGGGDRAPDCADRYETMQQTISPSDELFVQLVTSGVFAKLSARVSTPVLF